MISVAIPSYQRPERCARTVLQLARHGVPEECITVFCVADEMQAYSRALLRDVAIEVTKQGLDNAMHTIFESLRGERFVKLDDDVEAFRKDGELVEDVAALFDWGFEHAPGADLWGTPMSLRPTFANGPLLGFSATHPFTVSLPILVDYELSCQAIAAGSLTLLPTIQFHAGLRTEGGLGNGPERALAERSAYRRLSSRFPRLVK